MPLIILYTLDLFNKHTEYVCLLVATATILIYTNEKVAHATKRRKLTCRIIDIDPSGN